MIEIITAIIAGISLVISILSAIGVVYQTRKGWYVSTVTPQRLVWADNLRNAVSDFVNAYYEKRDLRGPRDKILLYLTPQNTKHDKLISVLNRMCNEKCDCVDDLIEETQELLRWNWWMVKSESTITHVEEKQRDEMVNKRKEWHSKRNK